MVEHDCQTVGLIAAHAVIDDMYRAVLEQETPDPNPYVERAQ